MTKKVRKIERRSWQRLPIAIPMFVRGTDEKGKEFLEFTTVLNISAVGALLAIRRNIPLSSLVLLEIPSAPLPEMGASPQIVKKLSAQIVRVTHLAECDLWGLEFVTPLVTPRDAHDGPLWKE